LRSQKQETLHLAATVREQLRDRLPRHERCAPMTAHHLPYHLRPVARGLCLTVVRRANSRRLAEGTLRTLRTVEGKGKRRRRMLPRTTGRSAARLEEEGMRRACAGELAVGWLIDDGQGDAMCSRPLIRPLPDVREMKACLLHGWWSCCSPQPAWLAAHPSTPTRRTRHVPQGCRSVPT
jgi:hypothetical protein